MFPHPWRIPRRWKVLFWHLSDRLFGARVDPPAPVQHPRDPTPFVRRDKPTSHTGD